MKEVESSKRPAHKFGVSPKQAPLHTSLTALRVPWKIDELLNKLSGEPVRVAAEAFAPVGLNGKTGRLTAVSELILPDNSRPEGLPVFFEGVLLQKVREVGVIHVQLGEPLNTDASAQGRIPFRGKLAIILRGPAIVRLAVPFHIEKLPSSGANYWEDLKLPGAQFLLSLNREG